MARILQIQARRGTAATWTSTNPTLAAGELGYETDTGSTKIGDGATAWTALAYLAQPEGWVPPTTGILLPSYATAATAAVVTGGNLCFVPFKIGRRALTIQNIGFGCTIAQTGGSVTYNLGLYGDDGTGTMPDTTNQLNAGTVGLTVLTTGNKTFAISRTLAPGAIVWGAYLAIVNSAPGTAATINYISGGLSMPIASGTTIGSSFNRGWTKSGQTVLPTTDIRSTLVPTNASAPLLALQAA